MTYRMIQTKKKTSCASGKTKCSLLQKLELEAKAAPDKPYQTLRARMLRYDIRRGVWRVIASCLQLSWPRQTREHGKIRAVLMPCNECGRQSGAPGLACCAKAQLNKRS